MEKGTSSRASSGLSHEVFLSFRGADTRHGFTDCLYHGLVDAGIVVFRDSESLQVGEEIGRELLQAIENSKIYIPIFSENYASSHWCLRELAYMVECTSRSNGNKEILPIFLDVEPEDVKLKTNSYKQALSKRQKTCTEVESWEKALVEVGGLKGWNWEKNKGQGELIRSIIQTVSFKLKVADENVPEHLIGVDDHVEAIIKMLDVGADSTRFLGIHGMGGVGKTTLAKVVFNKISSSFHRCCFIADVRESSKANNGMVKLQKQLLSKLLDHHSIQEIYHVNDGINELNRGLLGNKKVLIVLDDVDEKEHLRNLARKGSWFGSGSRIIITTRDQSILRIEEEAIGERSHVLTYEACGLKFDHALELFSRHAFRRDSPPDDYVSLSKKIVSTLGKLPLAIEITGSSLNGESIELWVETLKKLEQAPPMEVQKKLLISYEKLEHEQRQVFLDIACFFVNENKTYPFYMWDDCGYHPYNAIQVLVLMSLIKIKDHNTLWIHDQVRNLGRELVRQENLNNPYKRSRVCNFEEALSILKQKQGSKKIQALFIGYRGEDIVLRHDEFANLRNLRFFKGSGFSLVGNFNNLLSNLRWLSIPDCPPKFEATNLHLTNLVVLDLSWSRISEEWIGWNQIKMASKLKVLDLKYCVLLKRTPDLSTWVSLERLNLEDCCSLIEIDPSIGKLKLLTCLNLGGCQSLRELPEEIGCLQALTEIVMPNTLHELPKTFGNLKSLLTFDLPNRQISTLPNSIGGLVKIRRLDFSECSMLKELPNSIGRLESLVELDLSRTFISHIPESIGDLKQLRVLRMFGMIRLTKLPSAIGLLEKLEVLDAGKCFVLSGKIPKEIGRLSCLRILRLSWTRISGLPTTLSRLSSLQTLELDTCPKLQVLTELPPSLTCLRWTLDAQILLLAGMPLKVESIYRCSGGIGRLPQLQSLSLSCLGFPFLSLLPSTLRDLQLFDLLVPTSPNMGVSRIIPTELVRLRLFHCTFRNREALFRMEMKRLSSLSISGCSFFQDVIDLSRMKNLRDIDLNGCHSLVEICGLEELGSLCSLSVKRCPSLKRIWVWDPSKLKKLTKLCVKHCPKLRSVEGLKNHLESLESVTIYNAGEFWV